MYGVGSEKIVSHNRGSCVTTTRSTKVSDVWSCLVHLIEKGGTGFQNRLLNISVVMNHGTSRTPLTKGLKVRGSDRYYLFISLDKV